MSLAAAADLVISAAGSSLSELLCIGAAAAVVCVADNQQLGYARVVAAGTAAGLGSSMTYGRAGRGRRRLARCFRTRSA